MKTIGKTSKDNVVVLTIASLIFLIGSIILFVFGFVIRQEGRIAMFILSPLCLFISFTYVLWIIIQKKRTTEAIVYDEDRKMFQLNKTEISLYKIKEVKRLYRGMPRLFTLFLVPGENEFGSIQFLLDDGTRIKSFSVERVDHVFDCVKEIIHNEKAI